MLTSSWREYGWPEKSSRKAARQAAYREELSRLERREREGVNAAVIIRRRDGLVTSVNVNGERLSW